MIRDYETRIESYLSDHEVSSYYIASREIGIPYTAFYGYCKEHGIRSAIVIDGKRGKNHHTEHVQVMDIRDYMINYHESETMRIDFTEDSIRRMKGKSKRIPRKDGLPMETLTVIIGRGEHKFFYRSHGKPNHNTILRLVKPLIEVYGIKIILCDNEFTFLKALGIMVCKLGKVEFLGSLMCTYHSTIKRLAHAIIYQWMLQNRLTFDSVLMVGFDKVKAIYDHVLKAYNWLPLETMIKETITESIPCTIKA